MRRTITNAMIFLVIILISFGFSSLDEKGKVHLKVTKEENGETSVFEKVYSNMEALKSDKELMDFDALLKDWADDHPEGIFIEKRIDLNTVSTWATDEDEEIAENGKQIIIKEKFGDDELNEVEGEKIIRIKTDGEDMEFTITADGEGEIHKKIEVITSDEEDGKKKVIIVKGDDHDTAEIEVNIEKEIDKDGNEVITNKNVWITKDGKKIKLDGVDDYAFKTDGDKITLEVDEKNIDITHLSDEESNKMIFFKTKAGEKSGVKQTMNISIEEENGEKFIEIDIKRSDSLHVNISEILKDDSSLDGIDYSLKNNLKPSQFSYYPNPNNGKFNLKFTLNPKEDVTVKIMDILGNEVYKEKILDFDGTYDNQLDLTDKEKGIYILQILQKKKILTRKILIE